MGLMIAAVITGDIVNSTRLEKKAEKKLISRISQILKPYVFEFYRGDSFQVVVADPKEALQVLLLVRTAAKCITPELANPLADIRASIGIGEITEPVKNVKGATGEAFVLSGRSFDDMYKTGRCLRIQSHNEIISIGLKVIARYIDSLFEQLTSKQSAVVFELLKGANQVEIATLLGKSQATINRHAQTARWAEIKELLEDYKLLMDKL